MNVGREPAPKETAWIRESKSESASTMFSTPETLLLTKTRFLMPLGVEPVVVVAVPVVFIATTAVPLDPVPSLAIAVTVTFPTVLPALKNPAESMTAFAVTDHDTGTFAVNCRVAPVFTVAVEGEMNTIVEFEPPQPNSAAKRQHNEIRTKAFFNPGAPRKG